MERVRASEFAFEEECAVADAFIGEEEELTGLTKSSGDEDHVVDEEFVEDTIRGLLENDQAQGWELAENPGDGYGEDEAHTETEMCNMMDDDDAMILQPSTQSKDLSGKSFAFL